MAALWHGIARWFAPVFDPICNPLACLPPPPASIPTLSAEALLRQLDARLRQRLNALDVGDRDSLRRGQGLDFAELREYCPGDDIRKMDWNVFARTMTPHVREYHEEKRQTFWILADCTLSMGFGRAIRKWDTVLALAGYLGLLARQGGHRLGVVIMRESGNELISPQSGELAIRQLLKRLLSALNGQEVAQEQSSALKDNLKLKKQSLNSIDNTNSIERADPLVAACNQLARVVEKQSTVFLLSDFLAWPVESSVESKSESKEKSKTAAKESDQTAKHEGNASPSFSGLPWQRSLGQLSRQVRLFAMPIFDPAELTLPAQIGLLPVFDPETGDVAQLDTNNAAFRAAYAAEMTERQRVLYDCLQKMATLVPVSCEENPLDVLLSLLKGGSFAIQRGMH